DEAMDERAGREIGARIGRSTEDAVLEGVEAGAVGGRGAVLLGILPVLAVLPIEGDAREIDRPLAFPAPVERDALALAAVEAFEPVGRAAETGADAGQPVRVEVGVEIFAGQAQLVAVRGIVNAARERGVGAAVLRIGRGPRGAGT